MITVSPAFITAAKAYAKTPCAYLDVNGNTLSDDDIQSFTIERSLCVSGTWTLGSTVSAQLNAVVTTASVTGITLDGASVVPYMGYVVNGANDYVTEPTFYIDGSTVQNQGLFTSFTAYDVFMLPWMDEQIDPSFVTAFSAAATPAANIAAFEGVYTGHTFDYSSVPNTGGTPVLIDGAMTVREVLGRLAVAAGCNCMGGITSEVCFVYPNTDTSNPDETLTNANYRSCTIDGSDTTFVTYMQASAEISGEEVTNQYPDNATVSQNTIRNTGLAFDSTVFSDVSTPALTEVFSRWATLTVPPIASVYYYGYQGHDVDIMGLPYLEPGDLIDFTDPNGDTYMLCPLTVTHGYDGNLRTNIAATTISVENATQASVASSISVATSSINANVSALAGTVSDVASDVASNTAGVAALNNSVNSLDSELDTLTANYDAFAQSAADNIAALQAGLAAAEAAMTALYGTCTDSSATIAKTVLDMPDFTLITGKAITIKFTYGHGCAAPTLEVNGTGAFPIYGNDATLDFPSAYGWEAGQYVRFVFANGAWNIVGANPANFVGVVDDGIGGKLVRVSTDSTASGFHTDIAADSIKMMNGATTQMQLDSTGITIGADTQYQMTLDSGGMTLTNGVANNAKMTLQATSLVLAAGSTNNATLTSETFSVDTASHEHVQFVDIDTPTNTPRYVIERTGGHLRFMTF